MSFCRPASEITSFLASNEVYDCIKDMDPEELVLQVRNGEIYQMIADIDDTLDNNDNICKMMDIVEDIREGIIISGFIRPDITYVSSPEMYFTVHYIAELGLVDDYISKCMPYFETNEDYESYVFCYERVERIFQILNKILDDKELYEVILDVSYLDANVCETDILQDAKRKIVAHKDEISKDLEEAFAIF